jgi:hypothetical protein
MLTEKSGLERIIFEGNKEKNKNKENLKVREGKCVLDDWASTTHRIIAKAAFRPAPGPRQICTGPDCDRHCLLFSL